MTCLALSMNKIYFLILYWIFISLPAYTQSNIVTYAGGVGNETFYDVIQLTDGTFLVTGYAEDLEFKLRSIIAI